MFLLKASLQFSSAVSGIMGPFTIVRVRTREVRLVPYQIEFRFTLSVATCTKLEGMTHLIDEGGRTRVIHRTDAIPKAWIPAAVGKIFIEHEMREQFNEMRNEIIQRKRANLKETEMKDTR